MISIWSALSTTSADATTSAIGNFTGSSVVSVRDYMLEAVTNAFKARGFKSEIFIVAGENGTWITTTT